MKIRHLSRTGSIRETDLFGTFAALARDEVADFPALRAHQRHPWHAFAVQVAALALLRAERTQPPGEADDWRGLLHALAAPEAWELVVDDWSKPALLQPPGLHAAMARTAKRAVTPDELDTVIRTSRNHDLKRSRIETASDEDWFFHLLSVQTQDGRVGPGSGAFPVSRMNGAHGARVAVSLWPVEDRPGTAFLRDLGQLLALRPRIVTGTVAAGDVGLVWTLPWDGATSLPFDRLDPYYVEICRRVRLVREGGRIAAVLANSAAARIEAKALHGVTGDPWAPVEAAGAKSWGVSEQGFSYRTMVDLLDPTKVRPAPLAEPTPEDGSEGLTLLAAAVARGEGRTEGFHERRIPVPAKAASLFAQRRDRLGTVAKSRRDDAGEAGRYLRHALRVLAQGGPDRPKVDLEDCNRRIQRFERQFDRMVDAAFFDSDFWEHAASEDPATEDWSHLLAWRNRLSDMAERTLASAEAALPRSETRRLRAVARARSALAAGLRRFCNPDGKAA